MGAPTVAASGTATSDGTEQTLATITTPGAYELIVDMGAMANTEVVLLRIKEPVLAGGTTRSTQYLSYTASGSAAPEPSARVLGPVSIDQSATFTLQRTSGSARAHPWKVKRLA
jgi:hypothetical protein